MSFWVRSYAPRAEARRGITVPPSLFATAGIDDYNGVSVNTMEDALRGVAINAAVGLFSGIVSELPVSVWSGVGEDKQPRKTPGYFEDPGGDGYGREDWITRLMVSWLLRGNLYGEATSTIAGNVPITIDVWHPDTVTLTIKNGAAEWSHNGQPVNAATFVHRRVNPLPGQVVGQSVIANHATQLAISQTAARFGLSWFRGGGHPRMMLLNDQIDIQSLDDDAVKLIKARFMAGLHGRDPALIGRGWTVEQVKVTPEESQFLATTGASEAQCCRMFGAGVAELLGYESGGTLTYANVESRMTHLLILSLGRWIRRTERMLSSMLPRPQYVVLDRDAILETTTLARYQAHHLALMDGWKVINDIRPGEGLSRVPWGDEPYKLGQAQAGGQPSEGDDDLPPNGSEAPPVGRK
jgi:HK97 family phage portal protein